MLIQKKIKIISIVQITLATILSLLYLLALITFEMAFNLLLMQGYNFPTDYSSIFGMTVLFLLLTSYSIAVGVGLYKKKKWARISVFILGGIGILFSLITIWALSVLKTSQVSSEVFLLDIIIYSIPIIYWSYLSYFFNKREVKKMFR